MKNQLWKGLLLLIRAASRFPNRSFDSHSLVVYSLVKAGLKKYAYRAPHELPKAHSAADQDAPYELFADGGQQGIKIAAFDDDNVLRNRGPLKWLVDKNNELTRAKDFDDDWSNSDEAKDELALALAPNLPKANVSWNDINSDETFGTFVLQGIGCHRLRKLELDGEAVFAIQLDHLSSVPVRQGMSQYGGDAYVTTDGQPIKITLYGKDVFPGDDNWEEAKFIFRTSLLIYVTVTDHLGETHYGLSNSLLTSMKRHLGPDHPLRQLMSPFVYRTGVINYNSLTSLSAHGGILERTVGFTKPGLVSLYKNMLSSIKIEDFNDKLNRQGLHPSQLTKQELDRLPFVVDGLDYWRLVRSFIDEAFDSSEGLKAMVSQDPPCQTLQNWWLDFHALFESKPEKLTIERLKITLSHLIVYVTAMHSHFGHVAPYLSDPRMMSGRIRKGSTKADVQNSYQLNTIATITGLAVPGIVGDFSHMMPDEETKTAMRHFQQGLEKLQMDIDERNKNRKFPFMGFSPREIPCSVSR